MVIYFYFLGASTTSLEGWTDGSFVRLGYEIVGPWLGIWLIISSGLTNIGMFIAEMSSDAWMVAGMAERGMIPKVLGTRNRYGTPTYGVCLSAIGVVFLSFLSFVDIIEMLNMLFCAAQAIEFIAFLYLRAYRMDIPRPYMIPLSFPYLCVFISVPLFFIGIIIAWSSISCLFISSCAIAMGVLMYYLIDYTRIHQWIEYEPIQMKGDYSYRRIPDGIPMENIDQRI